MKLVFTKNYEELKDKLSTIGGEWDESQPNKKVLRLNGGVMSWYESTGTIQFQGKEQAKRSLENKVKSLLYPDEYPEVITPDLISKEDTDSKIENIRNNEDISEKYLNGRFDGSEIIIGIVSAVGTEADRVVRPLIDRLKKFTYSVEQIRVSSLLGEVSINNEYERIRELMNKGNELRSKSEKNAILSYGVAKLISEKRNKNNPKRAYIVISLKHPDEVEMLRKIYGQGFYLFGIHADKKRRLTYLVSDKGLTDNQASELTEIDEDEKIAHGQRTRDTFHLSDFFINLGKNDDQVKNTIQRFLELIFAHPYKNPTFDEYAMFMAFSSSVRSGDLSRQVGAVIA